MPAKRNIKGVNQHAIASAFQFYHEQVAPLPLYLVLDTARPVRKLQSIFGDDGEYLVCKIVEAVTDRASSNTMVSMLSGGIYEDATHGQKVSRVRMLEHMVTLEQCALDIRDALMASGCYLNQRWFPYLYEDLMPDGSILMRRPLSFEEFCDEISWANNLSIGDE